MNLFFTILLKSLVIGALVGAGVGAGAARMFHAPEIQGMGAFRTFGELNASEGDSIAHFSFGLGFFFNAWASAVGAGSLTQDVSHRIIPNWAAAAVIAKEGKDTPIEETMHDPKKMAIAGAIIGAVLLAFLNSTVTAVPESMRVVASEVLTPAANLLINYVMPVIFWLAALDAGRRSGFWGTVLGGTAQLVMGNAVPGVVLGILIGKGVDDDGWNKVTKMLLATVIVLFVLSGFFRSFDIKLIESLGLGVPNWLQSLHGIFEIGG